MQDFHTNFLLFLFYDNRIQIHILMNKKKVNNHLNKIKNI